MIVDSKQKMLMPDELLKVAAENTKSQYPTEMVYAAFTREAQMPNTKFLRYGNVIFVVHGDLEQAGVGAFRAINADTAQNFLQASYQFVIDIYKAGYYKLTTKFEDQSLINVFKIIQRNPPNPNMGFDVKTGADGQYVVTLMVGDPNQIDLVKPIGKENLKRFMDTVRTVGAENAMMAAEQGDLGSEIVAAKNNVLGDSTQPPQQMGGALQGLRKPQMNQGEV